MERAPEIHVRRARPSDAERIAAFVNRARPRGRPIAHEDVLDRCGRVGFLLAETGEELVGLLGWHAENLVVRVTDLLVIPVELQAAAGGALVEMMEVAARELQCEVAILLMPPEALPEVKAFWENLGYGPRDVADLPRPWREAAREARPASERVVLKQLRAGRVLRPM